MTEPSPPPYYTPPNPAPAGLTEDELRHLQLIARAAYDGQLVSITGRQLRALLASHDAPTAPDLNALRANVPTEFYDYIDANYPPNTVISSPHWHASRIFRAACYAIEQAMKRAAP